MTPPQALSLEEWASNFYSSWFPFFGPQAERAPHYSWLHLVGAAAAYLPLCAICMSLAVVGAYQNGWSPVPVGTCSMDTDQVKSASLQFLSPTNPRWVESATYVSGDFLSPPGAAAKFIPAYNQNRIIKLLIHAKTVDGRGEIQVTLM